MLRIRKNTLIIVLCAALLNSQNITKLENHGALWHRMGEVHTTTSYSHLHIPIKTTKLRERQAFMKTISDRFQILEVPDSWPEEQKTLAKTRLRDLKRFVKATSSDTIERINEALEAVHPNSPLHQERIKRQIIIPILAGLAAGALSGSIAEGFTHNTVNQVLNQSQKVIAHTVEENLIDIHNNEEDIKKLNQT